jgi:DNA-binding SARP family transcriptional activator/tetratricopeptide (TPR) repeat protein
MPPVPDSAEANLFSDISPPKMRLFGPTRADWGDGRSFLPRTTKTRALMAVLALANARPVSRRLLMELLWPTREREQAQASLRQSVHELRGYLAPLKGACLRSEREHLTLRIEDIWIDVLYVETPEFAAPQVVDVFRGPLLGNLRGVSATFDTWILHEQQKLSDRIRQKLASILAQPRGGDETRKMAEAVLSYDASHQAAWTALAEFNIAAGDTVAAMDVVHRGLVQASRPDGPPEFDIKTMLARLLRKDVPKNAAPENTVPNDLQDDPRTRRTSNAFGVPWRAAYLAVAPTKPIGNASAEFALCIDWQIMSALSKFDELSCTPFGPARQSDGCPHYLAADGFDYLLEGCIDQFAGQDQIIVRLRDLLLKGEVFWSQRICRPSSGAGLFGADFVTLLAPQIVAEISKHRAALLENCAEPQLDISGLILRASRAVERLERHQLAAADKLLADAINQDRRHPALLAWLAYVQLMQLGQGWLSDVHSSQRRIGELVDRSLALNPNSATVLSIAGHVLAFTQNRLEEGLSLQEKALSRNPNLPSAWLFSGLAHTYAGEHIEAIRRFQCAKQLSPADQHAYFIDTGFGLAHLLNGDNGEALTESKNAIRLNPNFSSSFKIGVAASGYTDEGRGEPPLLQRLLRLEPGLTVERVLSRSPLTRHEDKARLSDGLRMAGLPR